jgi:hypothetical protein
MISKKFRQGSSALLAEGTGKVGWAVLLEI